MKITFDKPQPTLLDWNMLLVGNGFLNCLKGPIQLVIGLLFIVPSIVIMAFDRQKTESIKQARYSAIASITPETFKNELLSLDNIKTSSLYKNRKSAKNLLRHCNNEAEIDAAMYIVDHLDKLEFVRSSYLGEGKNLKDPNERGKLQKKINRGVIQYNIYLYKYNGRRWVIKTEEYWDGQEKLYSFTKKP